ncbi:MAG: methionine--tRNA ligase [Nanoarchaeota archaeon]|nr:methionine--tRNA ligase [Nanoarchaeota archaeon]
MIKNKFYITTSIIYTNGPPHIGHALEEIQADAIARFHRLKGDDVFFLTGSDEHGIKNFRAAKEADKTPQAFVNINTGYIKEILKLFKVSNTDYIRTTDKERHWPTAQDIWTKLVKSGDIYKKEYEGKYCTGCEAFVKDSDLFQGKCKLHNKEPEILHEENYFFKLSKYQNQLIKLIESDEYKIIPTSKKNEILNFIKTGLEDVSFSRSKEKLSWGIPVPGDETHTMYVWCDALTNYLSGIGYTTDKEKFNKYWPADVHLVGKDIIRFHAVFWPAMLLSVGLPLPKQLLVHGFLSSRGKKMSKSTGNVIDPLTQIQKYGPEAVRYYLLAGITSDDDADYSNAELISKTNSDLANGLGNLVNRVLTLTEKNFDGKVPPKYDGEIKEKFKDVPTKVENLINEFKLHHAVEEIMKFVYELNKYVNDKEPWKIKDKDELGKIMYELLEGIRLSSILLHPFVPDTCDRIREQLGLTEAPVWKDLEWGKLEGKIIKGEVLFKKIEV